MLVNVKGFQTESGRILCKYTPPTPSANSGLHRYIFFLFKQEDHLDQVAAYEDARRGKFSVSEFAKRYHLGKPVAILVPCAWTILELNTLVNNIL